MGPMAEVEVVEVVVLTRAMVSLLDRATASRATGAITRALTAAPAPTAREDLAAMVNPSQVEEDSPKPHILAVTHCGVVNFNSMSCLLCSPCRIQFSTL